jgi:hypothetical protein
VGSGAETEAIYNIGLILITMFKNEVLNVTLTMLFGTAFMYI